MTTLRPHGTDRATVPVAPGRLPFLGHWLRFGDRPHEFLSTLPGIAPMVRLSLPGQDTYVVTEPELIKEMLSGLRDQGPLIHRASAVLGEGITVLPGERHKKERRLIAPAFVRARIEQYAQVMTRLGAERAAAWRDGQRLAVNDEMHDLAMRTVAGSLFSGDLGLEVGERIHKTLPEVMTLVARRVTRPAWVDYLPLPDNLRFPGLIAALKSATSKIITAYRAELAADPELDHGDLLGTLLKARDEDGSTLNDAQVHDELINFLVGGTEAIGMTLTWAWHELGANPRIQAAVQAEVDEVLGGRPAAYGDLDRLELTKRVVTETLRKYAPWLSAREVPAGYSLGGYQLPEGAMLFVCPIAMHREPTLFRDPMRFDPDRWLPDAARTPEKGTYIPFGMGPRQCPGNVFALVEVALQLAILAGKWELRPVPGVAIQETVIGALVHPTQLPMTAHARH